MVIALDSGASGPGSSAGRGFCLVFLAKTLFTGEFLGNLTKLRGSDMR